jgi:hypothetical protein
MSLKAGNRTSYFLSNIDKFLLLMINEDSKSKSIKLCEYLVKTFKKKKKKERKK